LGNFTHHQKITLVDTNTQKWRELPFGKCYVSPYREEEGPVTLVVTRVAPNGNLIAGIFELDLLCKGIIQTYCISDISTEELEEQLDVDDEEIGLNIIDYPEAHSLVWSVYRFAKKLQIEPHGDFEESQYILNEDDGSELPVKIECGEDGKPVVFTSESTPNTELINQLSHLLGEDGFVIYEIDDEDFEEDESEDDNFDFPVNFDIQRFEELLLEKHPESEEVADMFNAIAPWLFAGEDLDDTDPVDEIDNLELIDSEDKEVNQEEKGIMLDLLRDEKYANQETRAEAVQNLYKTKPDSIALALMLSAALQDSKKTTEAIAVLEDAIAKKPTDISLRISLLSALIDLNIKKDIPLTMREINPDIESANTFMTIRFYALMAQYFSGQKDLRQALSYLYALEGVDVDLTIIDEWMKACIQCVKLKMTLEGLL
jgi:tetratricopeptide (TPR) repeat protein